MVVVVLLIGWVLLLLLLGLGLLVVIDVVHLTSVHLLLLIDIAWLHLGVLSVVGSRGLLGRRRLLVGGGEGFLLWGVVAITRLHRLLGMQWAWIRVPLVWHSWHGAKTVPLHGNLRKFSRLVSIRSGTRRLLICMQNMYVFSEE